MALTTTVKLTNGTSHPLRIIGYRGADLSQVPVGSIIQPGILNYPVAQYDYPQALDDHYDWIYLLDTVTLTEYQLYMEVDPTISGPHTFAYIGYYDPSSSEEDGNPLPFPDASSWSASWSTPQLLEYYLNAAPPALQNGPYQTFLLPPGAGITPIPIPLSRGQSYFWNAANANSKTDTYADLFLITTAPNAQPTISILDGSTQFGQYALTPRSLPIADTTDYGAWLIGDYNGDGIADLFGIKVNNTGGTIQVCVLDGSQYFQPFLLPLTDTPIPASDAANYRWALGVYGPNQTPSLWGIKVSNTGTQTVEAHALNGGEQYKSFLWQHGTVIPVSEAWTYAGWAMVDYNNGHLNLFGIKTQATDTGMVEVHIVDGSNDLESYLLQTYTCISAQYIGDWVGWTVADYLGNGFQDLFGINVANLQAGKVQVVIADGAYQS